ncbi:MULTISPECIES: DNA polymerase III subunit delta' [Kitasatospora]|uniref:DNA polymerase III subunit delta' n=1 Tax=Kitasatospora cineracea TaxID=88074 RepID=A0A3N4SC01_9ACTN|nr:MULTISPECIES: DNA polymerase III subunit delta' [Kitasatospora]RPE33944.1 DNA polymerase-3 subunit delta' [Kitasatospora cineracea]WAL72574.1 DNA polymerase III subunit delta' [Kitasatospora sp. YST-16]WNW38623.1 DNA polymerase III subunit delta' [Streptomyces sp. Li-HN-5-13]
MSVWDDLVGQDRVVEQLQAAARAARASVLAGRGGAAAGNASLMTHAWLFTGPPGAGQVTAARAFAAALQCTSPDLELGGVPGCGFCDGCHTVLSGSHADVKQVRTDGLSIGVGDMRDLVLRAASYPTGGRWSVILVDAAHRLTEAAANALLKGVEEPSPRTVWLLCAPSVQDVLPTIRSRCRLLVLRTPAAEAVADMLVRRDGVEPAAARIAALAGQGDIDRARRLAVDEQARSRRAEVLRIPLEVADLGGCLAAAQRLVDTAKADAEALAETQDARETEDLRAAYGAAEGSRAPRGMAGAVKELEKRQKSRATRTRRETLNVALGDLLGFYRDVLALQFGAGGELANEDQRPALQRVAGAGAAENTLRRIEAVLACRRALDRNVDPLLAVEAMTVALRAG